MYHEKIKIYEIKKHCEMEIREEKDRENEEEE